MKRITFWGFMALVCCLFSAPVHCLASDGMQPFVLVTDRFGSSNFSMINEDGTLTEQQALVRYTGSAEDNTYCNGVGDFDNDGVLDVIIAVGSDSGIVYRFGNIVDNGSFPQGEFTGPNRGLYPAKMAVADFDEDGNLDFIMTYDESESCDLFIGKGNMEFDEPIELTKTAPFYSTGADVGDFNGDGHADFVVVSYFGTTLACIHLGRGDGTFVKEEKFLDMSVSVAAADFDGDGLDDLALSYPGSWINIYISNRDSFEANGILSFDNVGMVWNHNLDQSPIDAWDFDGDEIQDLVVGSYRSGNGWTDIAVIKGLGGGQFIEYYDVISYGGAPHGLYYTHAAISAPTPFQPEMPEISNTPPVALISCDSPEVLAGQTIYVNDGGSYDDDGHIVSYAWDFGDGTTAEALAATEALATASAYYEAAEVLEAEHVYRAAGEYTITLTVTDDQGAVGSAEFLVKVSAITTDMRIFPRVLNLNSRSRRMHAWVTVPEGCDATQVGVDAIYVIDSDSQSQRVDLTNGNNSPVVKTNKWLARHNRFYIRFDRQATIKAIGTPSDQTTIRVEAYCNDGFPEFIADDTIRTIKRDRKKWGRWQRRCKRGPIKKR